MQTPTKAIVVFGTEKDKETGKFPAFVYAELDEAVRLFLKGHAPHIILCGRHSFKNLEPPEESEAFRMRRYIFDRYGHLARIAKRGVILLEQRSTSIPDNWAQLWLHYPTLQEVTLVTIRPLLPRIRFFGQKTCGNSVVITYAALQESPHRFPHERRRLAEARCMLEILGGGSVTLLVDELGRSIWPALLRYHHAHCPQHERLHSAVAAA